MGLQPHSMKPGEKELRDEYQRHFDEIGNLRGMRDDVAFTVTDPSTEETLEQLAPTSVEAIDAMVTELRDAQIPWAARPIGVRRGVLQEILADLRARVEMFARLLVAETGKTLREATSEVRSAIDDSVSLTEIPLHDLSGRGATLRYRPLGVVAVIAPWNAPFLLALKPMIQALYTGNTVLVKPSPCAPLTVHALCMHLARRLTGVRVALGSAATGAYIVRHRGIAMVAFTGSIAIGRQIMAAAAVDMKRLTLELGGNDPAIVMPDANLETAVPAIFRSATMNAGQTCKRVNRVYAARERYLEVVEALRELARDTRVGPGLQAESDMGPVQNMAAYLRLRKLMSSVCASGATVFARGPEVPDKGYFLRPTIVSDIAADHALVVEETFGPFLAVVPYDNVNEAIAMANGTPYGLGASLWTGDVARARELAPHLQAGTVWINQHGVTSPYLPFGGAKQSGYGRNYGEIGLRGYMEPQVINER